MALTVYSSLERGKLTARGDSSDQLTTCSDGNIRYYEYENDKFEYLSEHKSPEPQRGLAFMPRRGINVSAQYNIGHFRANQTRFMTMRS